MRKNLLKFICFLLIVNDYVFCGSLGAQSIPNGDFSAEWVRKDECYSFCS